VDWRVWQWTRQHPDPAEWQVSKGYRGWVTGFVLHGQPDGEVSPEQMPEQIQLW
jgi:hypothetical protein